MVGKTPVGMRTDDIVAAIKGPNGSFSLGNGAGVAEEGITIAMVDAKNTMVIGADGLYSKVRQTVFPQAPRPQYSGQAVWRAVLPRPADIETCVMWMGPRIKPGVNPVSKTEMYLFVTEPSPIKQHVDPATFADHLRGLLAED